MLIYLASGAYIFSVLLNESAFFACEKLPGTLKSRYFKCLLLVFFKVPASGYTKRDKILPVLFPLCILIKYLAFNCLHHHLENKIILHCSKAN